MSLLPFQPQASSMAAPIDTLFYALLALCGLVVLGVTVAIVYFSVKYRRGSKADRTPRTQHRVWIELGWTLIPLALFLGIFIWGVLLYARLLTPPADAAPVYVVAKQWMWRVQHPGGQREINQLHVPLGQPVRLIMTSQDVIHSFYVPAFRIKQDVVPGMYTDMWFTATQAGTFELFCAEFCGTDHAQMTGSVVVMAPADYARWLDQHPGRSLAQRGESLFRRFGCSGCHEPGASVHAPPLNDLYGRPVPLAGGGTVIADDRYLHDSIMLPDKHIAAGYPPIMPSFQGQIGEDDVLALIAYIKSRHDPESDAHDPD